MQKMYGELLKILPQGWRGYSGFRSFKEQEELYAKGRTAPGPIVTKAPPGASWHNFGVACDLADFSLRDPWKADFGLLQEACDKLGLVWGGRIRGLVDLPHCNLDLKVSIQELNRIYRTYGPDEVNRLIFVYGDKYSGKGA